MTGPVPDRRRCAPTVCVSVVAGDAGHSRFTSGSVFAGREWELAQLRAALREAQARRGQLFVVSGEAGIGKTRLVRKLADLAQGEQVRVLWGRCWEGEEAPAFWLWIQIFRSMIFGVDLNALVGAVGQSPPDLARLIPEFKGFVPDADALSYPPSDQARFRLFDIAAMSIAKGLWATSAHTSLTHARPSNGGPDGLSVFQM